MIRAFRSLSLGPLSLAVALALAAGATAAQAQGFSAPQKSEIEKIIKDYIIAHPEVLQEAMAELEKRQAAAEAEKSKTTIKNNAQTIFSSARQVTLARFQLKLFQRKYKEALDALTHSAFESLSAWMQPTPIPKALLVATAYRLLGEDAQARASYERAKNILEWAVEQNPLDASRHVLLGQSYAGLGRKDDAIREGKRAIELRPESQDAVDGIRMSLGLAQIYAMLGEGDMAIALLEHCVASPSGVTRNAVKLDPTWDSLRNYPRFQEMIALNSFANTIQKTNIPDRR